MSGSVLIGATLCCNKPFSSITKPSCRRICRSLLTDRTPPKQPSTCKVFNKQLYASCSEGPPHKVSPSSAQNLNGPGKHTPQGHPTCAVLPALGLAAGLASLCSAPAVAFTIHQEPDNALSLPTWIIHISSVIEWAIAMALVWKYAEVTGTHHALNGMHT